MPALLILYIIAYLDRVNVTFAQDKLESDLGFSGAVYGFGAGVFFIAYFFLEVPSNLALHKFGARKWIARIMLIWGMIRRGWCSCGGRRVLPRAVPARGRRGRFFPGVILYLSYWFPARERARAVGRSCRRSRSPTWSGRRSPGGSCPCCGVGGLEDWQWLFLIEAIPALVAGVLVLCGPRRRARGREVAAGRREALAGRAARGRGGGAATRERHTVVEAIKDPRVLTSASYFCMVVNVYGLSFWVGEIVDKVGGLSDVGKGFVTAIPYAIAIIGLVLISRHSDRTGERKLHVAVSLALGAVAFAVSTVVSPVAAIAALTVGLFFLLGAHPVFWAMPAALLSGPAAAAGIALVNSIGNLGGFVGPYLVGLMKDATGSTDGGLVTLARPLGIGAFLATRVAHDPAVERAPRASTGRFRRTETAAEPAQPVT